jgi:uncharacterized protein (TIGR02246 family)
MARVLRPKETIEEFIAAFITAWPNQDASIVASYFTEDAVYHNIPLVPAVGRQAIHAAIEGLMAMGGEVGVEVQDGLITAWRDYFDVSGLSLAEPRPEASPA